MIIAADEQPTARQRDLLQTVADKLIARRLEAPAILFLESLKPLSFLTAQGLIVLGPLLQPLLSVKDYDLLTESLENRDNLEWLIRRLEDAEEKRGRRSA
jgi:hypothetical protein